MTNRRMGEDGTISLTQVIGTAAAIELGAANMATGSLIIPSGSTVTSLDWYGSHDGENYFAVSGASGADAQAVVAGELAQFPDQCFGVPYLKIVADADQAGVSIRTCC